MLTSRLESFVASGIMEREGSADYILTAKGRALAVALVALTEWGDEWASPIEPPILYRHTACDDGAAHAVVTCEACDTVPADEIAVRIGPGMPADYLAERRGGTRAN